jgi:hypothetical protein
MSTEERESTGERESTEEQSPEPKTDDHHQVIEQPDPPPPTEKPEVTDEHKQKAKEMRKDYEEERPTIAMPGTGGAVAGTAVNDWVDDEGNPKFGDESKKQDEKDEA